ncbi:hypothetical protein CYY_001417 [Polysphondylium violaceum]|uniref:CP-type G domain-containing protein n=1 Tax=Polysphondylium violaceum TaxID=133409 RepID=A0A8J4Q362_9MYCE|nr:hypothetical protein CYY_001417 [Polysphondylium violaceum]
MGKQTASKRQSLHKKHKVEKKVAEHRRKIRKLARDNPKLTKSKKDPGIPNLWPFKEEMLHKIEMAKQKASDEKKKKKELRKVEQQRDLASMAMEAKQRDEEFNRKQEVKRQLKEQSGSFQKEIKDNSLKAFYREVKKVIESADVILQVLDARDPLGCRCLEVEQMILERYTGKKIVLILNKIDLVPKENVMLWLKYLRNFYPTLAFKCSTQNQKRNLGQSSVQPEAASKELLNATESLGAEQLLQLLKNYSRSLNIKTSVNVGIIGYPNVGKSSLINSLKRTRSVGVGATPGFTKVAQEVHLDKNVKLLDSPGIVPIRGAIDDNIILRNVVKLEKITDPIAPIDSILQRCSKEQILTIYEIADYSNTTEFLTSIANKRKKIIRGGVVDLKSAAISVIRDWTGGKIPFYTQPPKANPTGKAATIVSQFSEEFNIDQTDLISSLREKKSSEFASLEASDKSGQVDTSMFDNLEEEEMEEDDEEEMEDDDEEEMEEEDEDDDEDEEDEMDEDEDSILQYQQKLLQQQKQVVSATSKAISNGPKGKVQNLKDENDQYNPQSNKSNKKNAKKLKKKFGLITTSTGKNVRQDEDDEEQVDDDDEQDIDEDDVFN